MSKVLTGFWLRGLWSSITAITRSVLFSQSFQEVGTISGLLYSLLGQHAYSFVMAQPHAVRWHFNHRVTWDQKDTWEILTSVQYLSALQIMDSIWERLIIGDTGHINATVLQSSMILVWKVSYTELITELGIPELGLFPFNHYPFIILDEHYPFSVRLAAVSSPVFQMEAFPIPSWNAGMKTVTFKVQDMYSAALGMETAHKRISECLVGPTPLQYLYVEALTVPVFLV